MTVATSSGVDQSTDARHPNGSRAKILLCSVFGPYAQDDEYGSRLINPMELWHNQVTRVQGPFSLRMFHRSWGMMLIQANIKAPCTMLDFPTLDRFIEEITTNHYDVVGIGSILPNIQKVKLMCSLIREHLPSATIVIGGHIAGLEDLSSHIDADHIVRGDGIRWFREFLGQDADEPVLHPQIWAGINRHAMGLDLPFSPRTASAALIPSVGCPIGCNFCATSAMFGGRGKSVAFYSTGAELFAIMSQLQDTMKIRSFFVMDENFLLNKPRAMELLALMQKHNKAWALYVFSSANALKQYTMDELVALGISWLWMGLEGKNSQYGKLNRTDTHQFVRELQEHGIRVLGSSIIGLEDHTPENIDAAIAHAVAHDSDFHQFMLYTPVAGTPLYAQHQANGTLLSEDEISFEDTHGQWRFNFRHPHIKDGRETEFLLRAFSEDFRINGPSVLRVVQTTLKGYRRYKNHTDARIRDRFKWEAEGMASVFPGAIWAAIRYFKDSPALVSRLSVLLAELKKEFGLGARVAAPLVGRVILHKLRKEAARLAHGWTIEPPMYYERNYNDGTAPQVKTVPGLTKAFATAAGR